VRWIDWEIPLVAHRTIGADEVEGEVERFGVARAQALEQVARLQAETAQRIGPFEGKVFESQAMMIEDPDLVRGTISYIRDNFICAERAFDWQMLEMRVRIQESAHAMLVDRLADLRDVRIRVLSQLLEHSDPSELVLAGDEPSILAGSELPPSIAARLEPEHILGVVTAGGSRGSHGVILARALGIPVVVGVGPDLQSIEEGSHVLIDGRTGEIRVDPGQAEVEGFHRAAAQANRRREMLQSIATRPTETTDGVHTVVQANLDLPHETDDALRLGADGVGLFRTEFLVIGRREIPDEEDQYQAYRRVLEAFPDREVTLRTFDIGGDKFPLFLTMPQEDNPYLGWRAIRVCLDLPDLFRNQLRAAVRAAEGKVLRLLVPFVTSVEEMCKTRELLGEVYESLGLSGSGRRIPLGVMVETPAAVETLDLLAPYVDFVSLGTNDLTQYVLAADRGNAKLGRLYDPLHPALVRMYARVAQESRRHDLDLSVCGELAGDPLGIALLLGLGYRKFSVSIPVLPEIRDLIRNVSVSDLARVAGRLNRAEDGSAIRMLLRRYLVESGALPDQAAVGLSEG
jgi:phosphotransferase system enzyme I (PtsI)